MASQKSAVALLVSIVVVIAVLGAMGGFVAMRVLSDRRDDDGSRLRRTADDGDGKGGKRLAHKAARADDEPKAERTSRSNPLPSAKAAPDVLPSAPPAPPSPPSPDSAPLEAADMSAVDPSRVLAQAVALAKRKKPQARLISADFAELEAGKLNFEAESRAAVTFEFHYTDAEKPPGEDLVEGLFTVSVRDSHLIAFGAIDKAITLSTKTGGAYPLPIPACTAEKAWAAAVKSDVPANSVARMMYQKWPPFGDGGVVQWSIRVEGHDELRRELDARSCALIKRWDH